MLYAQVEHRGREVTSALETRKACRRNRRSRETLYRRCRFRNGSDFRSGRPDGWLPPSQESIAANVISIVKKLGKLIRLTTCSFEAVRFDTQKLDQPEISGAAYQHGTLFGYEIREYLLEKYRHTCQYCGGASGDKILEWEHMLPRSRGGSDSIKNASLACRSCNQAKDDRTLEEWLSELSGKKTALAKERIRNVSAVLSGTKQVRGSDRYAAWANVTRRRIERDLFRIFGTVECSSGGRTKHNRERLHLPKDHHYDALCVGEVPENGFVDRTHGYVTFIKAMGRGTRFRGKTNACGVITQKLGPRAKRIFGFANGDIVSADVPKGKYAGHYVGRVMTRASGSFDIRTTTGALVTANVKNIRLLQYGDGYRYRTAIPLGY